MTKAVALAVGEADRARIARKIAEAIEAARAALRASEPRLRAAAARREVVP